MTPIQNPIPIGTRVWWTSAGKRGKKIHYGRVLRYIAFGGGKFGYHEYEIEREIKDNTKGWVAKVRANLVRIAPALKQEPTKAAISWQR